MSACVKYCGVVCFCVSRRSALYSFLFPALCKMNLQEVGEGCEDWMELAQDRDRWRALVSTVKNLRVP
jgi:hypothetical protein